MASRAWRTVAGAGAFINGFLKGQEIGRGIRKDQQDEEVRSEIAAADENFTPRRTPAASGEEALAAGQQAHKDALKSAGSEEEIARVDSDFKPTLDALQTQRQTPASVVHSMGAGDAFKSQAQPFTAGEVDGAKARERASIYSRAGREDDAARVLTNETRRRALADDSELRAVMNPQNATSSNPQVATIREQGVGEPIQREKDGLASKAYYERKAPQIIDAYLKQGNLEGAKRYRDFVDSQEGLNYAEKWIRGVRKLAVGDYQGALNDWQSLYNDQVFNDGSTVKMALAEDGQMRVTQFDAKGKEIGARTMPIDTLARQAGIALAPEKLVELRAQQEAKRAAEAASLNKAVELENLRQEGQDSRDDRRDARLVKQIDAANARHAQGRGLTAAQERSNAEIDAAREAVAGLSPDDIRLRTAKTSDTGRENKLFDPGLARQAALANRRKVGDDELFDSPKPKPAAPAFDRVDVAKRFRADKTMSNRTLGKETPNGVEVLEKGKLIGYFQ